MQIKTLWQEYGWFRVYSVLLIVVLLKQLLWEARLVDGFEYMNAAQNWWHFGFPDSCNTSVPCDHVLGDTRRTPGYPFLLILACFQLIPMFLLQCVAALFVPVIALDILKIWGNGAKASRVFLILLTLYPLQWYYSAMLMPEILCQLLLLLTLRSWIKKQWWRSGMELTALILLKPVFLVLVFPALLFALLSLRQRMGLTLPLMAMLLVSFWNYRHTGDFHFTSVSEENAWEYNARAVRNQVQTESDRLQFETQVANEMKSLNHRQKRRRLAEAANSIIRQHWKLYLWLHVKGVAAAMFDPGRYDMAAFFQIDGGHGFMGIKAESGKQGSYPWWMMAYMLVFLLLNLLRWGLLIPLFLQRKSQYIIPAIILLLLLGITGPVGSARYLFPAMPVLLLLSASGAELLFKNREKNTTPE